MSMSYEPSDNDSGSAEEFASVSAPNTNAGVKVEQLCKICDDRAAGKYYGVVVCDGCKGFFRRSVRNNQVYFCRFDRNCVVGKDNRNQCRYCRLRKCFKAGMKKEAVQNERDRIRGRAAPGNEDNGEDNSNAITMACLIQADKLIRKPARFTAEPIDHRKKATANEFYDSTKEQLQVLISWAKYIPAFCDLPVEDRLALVRGFAADNLILGLVRRSLHLKDVLLLANGCVMDRDTAVEEIGVSNRILDELVKPLSRLKVDDTEFACLKAIIFFDPNATGLSNPDKIHSLRLQAQHLLEDYIIERATEPRGRFGEILLTLPALRGIIFRMLEEMQFRKFFGMAQIDKLLRETLLGDDPAGDSDPEIPPGVIPIIPVVMDTSSNSTLLPVPALPVQQSVIVSMKESEIQSNSNSNSSVNGFNFQTSRTAATATAIDQNSTIQFGDLR